MMQTLSQQYYGMLKKVDHYTRPPQACQDSPFREQGRRVKITAGVFVGYVEDVCEPRTQLGMGRALARLGPGGCDGAFFSFPLEGAHEL
ncbi:MAG: hypothetical protein M3Z35_09135 [Nitrospirota bacterium]|nr:hypothetical protein [Nitrospirota bacterium]